MQDWQQRVIDEKDQLQEKINKLTDFSSSDTYIALPRVQQELLVLQLAYMINYRDILSLRIKTF